MNTTQRVQINMLIIDLHYSFSSVTGLNVLWTSPMKYNLSLFKSIKNKIEYQLISFDFKRTSYVLVSC